jgi:hypothetical protein
VTCHVGKTDRVLRIMAGLAIIGAGVALQSGWGAGHLDLRIVTGKDDG